MAEALNRRRRLRRLWILLVVLALVALVIVLGLRALGCFDRPLDVTVTVHNTGTAPLRGLSLDQVDGAAHIVIPLIAAGSSVEVRLVSDDAFRKSHLDLVDDATGRNYSLPPHSLTGRLHGFIYVEVARADTGASLDGRARSETDSGADPRGWEPLRPD